MIKVLVDIYHLGMDDSDCINNKRIQQPLLAYLAKHGYSYRFIFNYIDFLDKLPIEERLLNLGNIEVMVEQQHFKFTKRIKYVEYLNETKMLLEISVKLPVPDSFFTKIKNFILRQIQPISYIYYKIWMDAEYFIIYKDPVDTIYECLTEKKA